MAKGLCAAHYQRVRRGGSVLEKRKTGKVPRPAFDRVWDQVEADGECLLYRGLRWGPQGGYSQILMGKVAGVPRNMLVHRLVYEMVHGPIPAGMEVMHECHKRTCIQPGHLRAGTRMENELMKDPFRLVSDQRRTGEARLRADRDSMRVFRK